jgi:hypothetical protein
VSQIAMNWIEIEPQTVVIDLKIATLIHQDQTLEQILKLQGKTIKVQIQDKIQGLNLIHLEEINPIQMLQEEEKITRKIPEVRHQEKKEVPILEDKSKYRILNKSTEKNRCFCFLYKNNSILFLKKLHTFINIKLYSNKFVDFF